MFDHFHSGSLLLSYAFMPHEKPELGTASEAEPFDVALRGTSRLRLSEKGLLTILCVVMAIVLWWRDLSIQGPFIFIDEARYFDLALRMFRDHIYYGATDYNPLYPLIISPAFALGSLVHAYEAIRVLNCIFWPLMIFPIYFVARRFVSKVPAVFIAVGAGLGPASTYVPMVRSEAIFFPLAAVVVLLFLRMTEAPSRTRICACGCATALLFLTKQLGAAFFFAILASLFYEWIRHRDVASLLRRCAWFVTSFAVITVPWLLRNFLDPRSGGIGHGTWTHKMYTDFDIARIVAGFGVNLAYIVVPLLGVFWFWYWTGTWRLLRSRSAASIFVFFTLALLICDLVICALICMVVPANARTVYYPNGRYLEVLVPWILIIAYMALLERENRGRYQLWSSVLVCLISCAVVFWYSPLLAVTAAASPDNASLVFLSFFYEGRTGMFWPAERTVEASARLTLALVPAVLFLLVLLIRCRALYVLGLGVVATVMIGFFTADFTGRVASSPRSINQISKQMWAAGVRQRDLAVDADMSPDVSPLAFWFSHNSDQWRSIPADAFRVPVTFEFGTTSLSAGERFVGIRAPWTGTSFFNKQQGYGFADTPVGEVSACKVQNLATGGGPGEYVFGRKPASFDIQVPDGSYAVRALIRGEQNGCAATKIDFDLQLGGCRLSVPATKANLVELPFECTATPVDGRLSLSFTPRPESIWAISRLEVRSLSAKPRDLPRFFISDKILRLPIRWRNESLCVYEIHK